MKLEKWNLTELNTQELVTIEGGKKIPKWGDLEKILTAIGIMDVVDRFTDGWNSHKC